MEFCEASKRKEKMTKMIFEKKILPDFKGDVVAFIGVKF